MGNDVVFNPLTGECYDPGSEHPLRHMPLPHYQALFWGAQSTLEVHESIPDSRNPEAVADFIRRLSVPPGQATGREYQLYDDYYQAGTPCRHITFVMTWERAQEYRAQLGF